MKLAEEGHLIRERTINQKFKELNQGKILWRSYFGPEFKRASFCKLLFYKSLYSNINSLPLAHINNSVTSNSQLFLKKRKIHKLPCTVLRCGAINYLLLNLYLVVVNDPSAHVGTGKEVILCCTLRSQQNSAPVLTSSWCLM